MEKEPIESGGGASQEGSFHGGRGKGEGGLQLSKT